MPKIETMDVDSFDSEVVIGLSIVFARETEGVTYCVLQWIIGPETSKVR